MESLEAEGNSIQFVQGSDNAMSKETASEQVDASNVNVATIFCLYSCKRFDER